MLLGSSLINVPLESDIYNVFICFNSNGSSNREKQHNISNRINKNVGVFGTFFVTFSAIVLLLMFY